MGPVTVRLVPIVTENSTPLVAMVFFVLLVCVAAAGGTV